MRKVKLFLGIILSGTVSLITVPGAEVGNRKMVWAHNTPWFYPANNPGYPVNYYNFPLQESKVTENLIASLREEVRIAQGCPSIVPLCFDAPVQRIAAHRLSGI